jgi:hypothetical protein
MPAEIIELRHGHDDKITVARSAIALIEPRMGGTSITRSMFATRMGAMLFLKF